MKLVCGFFGVLAVVGGLASFYGMCVGDPGPAFSWATNGLLYGLIADFWLRRATEKGHRP